MGVKFALNIYKFNNKGRNYTKIVRKIPSINKIVKHDQKKVPNPILRAVINFNQTKLF